MKKYKTLTSLLLALTLSLTLALPALAAEGTNTGSITVENPKQGVTYLAYKIFDVKYTSATGGTDKGSYQYTIDNTSPWFNAVTKEEDGQRVSNVPGLTITKEGDNQTYAVKMEGNSGSTENFSAAALANTLKKYLDDNKNTVSGEGQAVQLTPTGNGKVKATNLPLGYYLVTGASDALCNLTTTTPDSEIKEKNDVPFDKVVEEQSVEVGQNVPFKITGKVPNTTGYKTYTYKISDTMSEGLTFNKDVEVEIGGVKYDTTDKLTYPDNMNGFVLEIDVMKLTAGDDIEVTYTAKVNDKAICKISENKATLVYSNDPTNSDSTATIDVPEKVYSARIVIDKYEQGNEDTKLSGAEFVLMNNEGQYYKLANEIGSELIEKIEWVDNQSDATKLTTNATGEAMFRGLKDGTYRLIETKAPDGYNLLSGPVTIKVDGKAALGNENNETAITAALTVTAKVANNNGSVIPSTGGIGTTIFYVVGAVLVVGAGVLLVTKKRMEG